MVEEQKEELSEQRKYYYAQDNTFSTKNNNLSQQFINKLFCGDSEQILQKFPDNCIDLIFTSPPYNFGMNYEQTDDTISWRKYFEKLFSIFSQCIRVTKFGGRIIVNVQPLFSEYIPIHHIISHFFMENKLIWKGEILWEKQHYNCKYTAWGSWKSPSNPYLKYTWEFVEIFCKGQLLKEGESHSIDITDAEFKEWVYAKWCITPEIFMMKKWKNPAMFPEKLARRIIKLFSFQNDIILDPFNGVGTTTKVAKELSRKYIGIDISKTYCSLARQRLQDTGRQYSIDDFI